MVRFSIGNVSSYVPTLVPTEENTDREELFTLCTTLLYHHPRNNIDSKIKSYNSKN